MARLAGWLMTMALVGAACAPAAAAPSRVVIDIEHSRFVPATVIVAAGSTVTFVVRNSDPIDHEFLIGDSQMQQVHESGTEAHHGARPGELSLPALTTRTTTYTFDQEGSLIFGCHLPSHYAYGMRGTIRIER